MAGVTPGLFHMNILTCGKYRLQLKRPLVMGIVNLTGDSFSGDGLLDDVQVAVAHARKQWESGADILDVGAESSRPGALPVSEDEELKRLLPVLRELVTWDVPISVDTYKPVVMRAALDLGVSMINDIQAMRDEAALAAVRDSQCAVSLMHMQGNPGSMQLAPKYGGVVDEVGEFLHFAVDRCLGAGIARNRLILDPGFGFGKRLDHNLALFRAIGGGVWQGLPLLVGVSRKSMLGEITGRQVSQRLAGSVAAALLAAQRGAAVIRVHDVAETRDALAVLAAVEKQGEENES